MKISFNWLKEYITVEKSPQQVSDILTQSGLEVEGLELYEKIKGGLEGLVIGEVKACEQHPNADKLKKTLVDIGNGALKPIVCGAPNVSVGQKVIVAPTGTVLHPMEGDPFKIKKAKIRGEVSEGMICAEDEIGLSNNHEGIIELNTDLPAGTPASQYFDLKEDYIFEIGITPNRADATSHIGVARDLKAILKTDINWPRIDGFKVDNNDLPIQVEVRDSAGSPRYSGITIKNIEVKASPDWLKEKLLAIGQSPINNIVDITNFVLHEMGQPLHAFDADKIKGNKVIVQTLRQGTEFITLDGNKRELTQHDLMICNAEEGMCIAGVFGGKDSGVTENTKSIFLESAYFSPDYIRKTSAYHALKTDAAFRFERGTDPELTVYALKRAALLIKAIAGGEISSDIVDIYPEKISSFSIKVKYEHVDRLIGKQIPPATIEEILNLLDIQVTEKSSESFVAIVPPYRVDVTREADIIEEILRIYGYDNIEFSTKLSSSYLASFPEKDKTDQQIRLAQMLAASGYYEIQTNSLTKPQYAEKCEAFNAKENVEILNKLSEDLGVLRQSMIFSGLEVIAHNINRRQTDLKLFEFGKTYKNINDNFSEKELLSIWATGNYEPENWQRGSSRLEFHDFYAVVHKIINKFISNDYKSFPIKNDIFEFGLNIFFNNIELGKIGLLKKNVTKTAGVNQAVFYGEIDFERLLFEDFEAFKYKEIPKYPEVRRDLSLVIDKNITFSQIKEVLNRKDFGILNRVNVFDYYEGEKIDKNKKAYALSFILQDENKTLTDKTIDKVMNQLIKVYENELGAIIRK